SLLVKGASLRQNHDGFVLLQGSLHLVERLVIIAQLAVAAIFEAEHRHHVQRAEQFDVKGLLENIPANQEVQRLIEPAGQYTGLNKCGRVVGGQNNRLISWDAGPIRNIDLPEENGKRDRS